MSEFSWERDVLPVVEARAKASFWLRHNKNDLVCDVVSVAWEGHLAAPHAPPQSVAFYAIRRVRSEHQFGRVSRSIDGPNPRRVAKPIRVDFDPSDAFREQDDPSRVVAFREALDLLLALANDRQRQVASLLAVGDSAAEVAGKVGLSRARVTQIRRELLELWRSIGT